MDVSVIFVNYKTKELTINAIKSVIEKTEGIEYEIFVVDNNSQDGSIEAIQEEFNGVELAPHPNLPLEGKESSPLTGRGREGYTPIYIIKNPINAGFGAANNLAIKKARGKYILCLNTDTLLVNNAIKIMFDFMEKQENQKVGVCGGYLVDSDGHPTLSIHRLFSLEEIIYKLGLKYIFKNRYEKIKINIKSDEIELLNDIDCILGADIFFRKSVLDEVGLFDENIFMYCEETDLCKRIKDAGYEVKFVENAKIIHLEGQSTKQSLQSKKWFKQSQMYYFHKHHPHQVWLVKFIYIVLYLVDWVILGNKDSKKLLLLIINL